MKQFWGANWHQPSICLSCYWAFLGFLFFFLICLFLFSLSFENNLTQGLPDNSNNSGNSGNLADQSLQPLPDAWLVAECPMSSLEGALCYAFKMEKRGNS